MQCAVKYGPRLSNVQIVIPVRSWQWGETRHTFSLLVPLPFNPLIGLICHPQMTISILNSCVFLISFFFYLSHSNNHHLHHTFLFLIRHWKALWRSEKCSLDKEEMLTSLEKAAVTKRGWQRKGKNARKMITSVKKFKIKHKKKFLSQSLNEMKVKHKKRASFLSQSLISSHHIHGLS